ncbi:tetratricopeptide repeat protein [Flavobacterium davisii]|uniref:Uncharacterized protein n=1 Tax=Flavobacterium davisii TaxID=2906077 RepID=A0A246GLK9_9FLAO|nr:hypothetical protein [Flavobacterium davisii]OWP85333.1 hypothetical protein BWK59_00315 [Flavobacterium davisii]
MKLTSVLFLLIFISCGKNNQSESFEKFNEGVELNLKSIEEQNSGNYEKAVELNRLSIEKFRETLKIDSTHSTVRSALAHSLYIDKKYKEAIYWFEESNKVNGKQAQNYRELGLCKINLGNIELGKVSIDKAFEMDKSKEIRNLTMLDLTDIGNLAFEYGEGFTKQNELEKGKNYKIFSIGVLKLAYEYDNQNKELALKISEFANKINDIETSLKYKQLSKE